MIVGYARLSRDDYRKKYTSIENQKAIIERYAKEHNMIVDQIYEDDGVTGYTMDRPSFNEIKHLVDENKLDVLLVKDLSRLGRHNGNVLLFLERLKKHGVRVIMISDDYDSDKDDDSLIGIKTWYNERYVKDGSRKIREGLKIMQEKGNLIMNVPFGYEKDPYCKDKYYIDEEAATWVRKIFELYASGKGYKHTAKALNEMNAPTPSMLLDRKRKERGLVSNIRVAKAWEPNAIKTIITNDFYIGTLRLGKSVRNGIHGDQKRLSEDKHITFEDAHEPIISKELFNIVQSIHTKRKDEKTYKGERKYTNPYGGLLRCGDCGATLTICHYNEEGPLSYACRAYRTRGKNACTKHSINKKELDLIVHDYLTICRSAMHEMVESLDSILMAELKMHNGNDRRLQSLKDAIVETQKEVRVIMEQKIKEMAANKSMADVISDSYNSIQQEKLTKIQNLQAQINEYENIDKNKNGIKKNFKSAIELFDGIIKDRSFSKIQLETIIDKICVYDDDSIEIKLRGDLGDIFKYQSIMRMSKDKRIKRTVINYITDVNSFGQIKLINEIRKYDTIANYYIVPLINEFIEKGYVKQLKQKHSSGNPPYVCIATKEEMLRGFDICTDIDTICRYANLGANIETIVKISMWISRYI